MNYVVYTPDTGEITQHGFCDPEPFQHMVDAGWNILEANAHPDTHYVAGGAAVLRELTPFSISKTLIAADGEDGAVVSGFPAGSTVMFGGSVYDLEDPTLTLTATTPGTVAAILCGPKPQYRDVVVSVIAED
jgi:hypothetical protein